MTFKTIKEAQEFAKKKTLGNYLKFYTKHSLKGKQFEVQKTN